MNNALFPVWDADAILAAGTPNAFGVYRHKLDLSIERSERLGNLFVWDVQGLYLRNAADDKGGGIDVSVDAGANNALQPNAFYMSVGDAINLPRNKAVIGNRAQPNKFAYLESSDKIPLLPQSITDLTEGGSAIDVINIGTASGTDLSKIQGQFDGAFDKRDFVMSSDESYDLGNREWSRNLTKGALINPVGNVFWRNYITGFNSLSTTHGVASNFLQRYLTAGQTGGLMGGNVGYPCLYKLKFFFNFTDTNAQSVEIVDSGILFGGAAFGEVRPSAEQITVIKNGGNSTTNTIIKYPVIAIPANRTNDMVLEYITSPALSFGSDNDFDIACHWQRIERY